jgi:5-methylcytosine-specific restriction endonuclease McrA
LQADQRAAKKRERKRREAVKRGIQHDSYTLAEIAARDRYYCQLCTPRRRVAMNKIVPHPKAPTIDHVVPLAQGGDDTRANVQLAHFICNCLKSDGVVGTGEQLRLMG